MQTINDLDGRVAIVTGGSAGVGLGIATTLAAHGAHVVIAARQNDRVQRSAATLRQIHGDDAAIGVSADVTSTADIKGIVEAAMRTWSKIDILVNTAGAPAHVPFFESDDEAWQSDIELKLLAAVRLSRSVIPHMQRQGGGRIVNILSNGAKVHPAGSAPTSVTRAAGLALTKVLSKEFAADRILVNAVLISAVKSEQWERRWLKEGRQGTLDEFYAHLSRNIPLRRFAEPAEIGELVAFMVSDRGSYMTGSSVCIDGGASPVI